MTQGKNSSKCWEYKLVNEYQKGADKQLGVKSACKQCNRVLPRIHYQTNKEKYRQCYQEFLFRNLDYRKEYYCQK